MPKKLSALKKVQISSRNRSRNRIYKSMINTFTKKYVLSIKKMCDDNSQEVLFNLSMAYSNIDKAVKRGVLHKNAGARKKSILAKAMKNKSQ